MFISASLKSLLDIRAVIKSLSCHGLVGETSGRNRVYTTKDLWINVFQTTSGRSYHEYILIVVYDSIALNAFLGQV